MNEEIGKWIFLANGDLKSAEDLIMSREPVLISVCFHCQQAVEKYLKAYLFSYNINLKKTHNIYELLNCCIEIDKEFELLEKEQVDKLTIYAVEIRYPDDFYIPTIEEAKEAIGLAKKTKDFVIAKLKDKGFKLSL